MYLVKASKLVDMFQITRQKMWAYKLEKHDNGLVSLRDFAEAFIQDRRKKVATLDLAEESAKLARARTKDVEVSRKLKELQKAEKEKILVQAADVQKTWEKAILAFKSRLLSIPQMSPILADCDNANEIKELLQKAVMEALEELSNG